MEHADASAADALTQALVFLAATCLVVPALRRARLSAVMGFLLIGVAMGPHVLGRMAETWPWLSPFELEENEPTQLLAEFGVIFLLFIIGLEVSWERLWALRRYVFGLGLAQVLLTTCAITAVALALNNSFAVAAVLGLAFALSSTALVLQLLRERKQTTTVLGQASFSVLLLQDLMVVPILFAVSALSAGQENIGAQQIAIAIATAVGALAAIVVLGRLVLSPMFRWVAAIDSREVFIAAALLAAIGMSLLAQSAGLSMALGAFLAGMLLAETEFRHQIETDLGPLKDLLLGLFFVTVGMQIDLQQLLDQPLLIAFGVVALFVVKAALLTPLARAFGMNWPRAIEMAFLMGGVGEFAFIVVAVAQDGGVIPDAMAEYMLVVTALSMFATPFMAWIGRVIAGRFETANTLAAPAEAAAARNHVVIAGGGRVGQMLADILHDQNIRYIGVDADADLIASLRNAGRPFHYGDASRRDVLGAVGAARAIAIVVTMDRPESVERIVREVKAVWPDVPIYARARDAAHARRLREFGADLASPETVEAALQLGEALLVCCGVPDDMCRRIIEERRAREIANALGSVSSST
jgi:monovalent cation:proton antiporter-2 (CPA2) family protein